MSIPTDENRELLTVVATIRARPGKEEELRAMLTGVIEPSRAEDGCHTYALHQGVDDPSVFVFYENWTSKEHLAQHHASEHMVTGLAGVGELVVGGADIQILRRVG